MSYENKIRKEIIANLDAMYNKYAEYDFQGLNNAKDVTQDDLDDIESIFMSYRNIIAGTDWDGEKQEYETYKVRE